MSDEMRVVYIAHPVSGDVEANLASAAEWVRWAAVEMGVAPVAPYIEMCAAMDDDDPHEREVGMRADKAILARCDEVWLCGPLVSPGMRSEAMQALSKGIDVVWYVDRDAEPMSTWEAAAVPSKGQ